MTAVVTSVTRQQAWQDVGLWTVLLCGLFGVPGFVVLLNLLPQIWPLEAAALGVGTGIALGCVVLLDVVRWWLPRASLGMADLGWGRPLTLTGLVAALVVAALWLALSFFGISAALPELDLLALTPARLYAGLTLAFVGCVEELICRGVLMTRLQQAGVATWAQLLVAAGVFALYHSLHDLRSLPFSALLGLLWAGVYLAGGRSLAAPMLSHGLVNLLGEPYLLMFLIVSHHGQ